VVKLTIFLDQKNFIVIFSNSGLILRVPKILEQESNICKKSRSYLTNALGISFTEIFFGPFTYYVTLLGGGGVLDFVTVQTKEIFLHENFYDKEGRRGLKSRFFALRIIIYNF